MVVDALYGCNNDNNAHDGYNDVSAPAVSVSIPQGIIDSALSDIYHKNVDPDKDIDPALLNAFWQKFNEAAAKGMSESKAPTPEEDFRDALKYNNAVFSAFKVHRLQHDVAARLTDSNGNLKPFKQWLNDVQPIASHQCERWFQTEYSTAVIRAHQAADWQQFEREKDVLPNLEWMPSTSVHPGEDHQIFWGTVLPVDDPFWDEHRPGDRWNCKCSLTSTDKPCTDIPGGSKPNDNPQPGLDNNPGKDAKLFSDSHPYIANAAQGAEKAVEKAVEKAIEQRRNEIQETILGKKRDRFVSKEETGSIEISNVSIKEFLNQPHVHYYEKNELALDLNEAIAKSIFTTSHKPFKDTKRMKNVEMQFFYEIVIAGDKSWFIIDKFKNNGGCAFHGISDNAKVLEPPKNK